MLQKKSIMGVVSYGGIGFAHANRIQRERISVE